MAPVAVGVCGMVDIVPCLELCWRDTVAIAAYYFRDVPDRFGSGIVCRVGRVAIHSACLGGVDASSGCKGSREIYVDRAIGLVTGLGTCV